MSDNLIIRYAERRENILMPLAAELEEILKEFFRDGERIDRIAARAKSVDRFMDKAANMEKGVPKYSDPLNQIQDQVGARLVTFYEDDVNRISTTIEELFRPIEMKLVVPDRETDFGYFGKHYILLFPPDLINRFGDDAIPFFEMQIKTLFQHSWSEANHDLGYKPEGDLTPDLKRKLAFCSAQAWGADKMFNDVFNELNGKRMGRSEDQVE